MCKIEPHPIRWKFKVTPIGGRQSGLFNSNKSNYLDFIARINFAKAPNKAAIAKINSGLLI